MTGLSVLCWLVFAWLVGAGHVGPDPLLIVTMAGFFGFAQRSGWKTVGALYAQGALQGDYGSNEEPEVTTWYTRGAPRACDNQPEYYLIADDLVDSWPVDRENLQANYTVIGEIRLPNSKGLTIYQTRPAAAGLNPIQVDLLSLVYDRTARPAAFARSVLWLLGMVTSTTLGSAIHVLLVVAVVILVIRLISGRRAL